MANLRASAAALQGQGEESAPKLELPSSQPPLNASQVPAEVEESAPKFVKPSSQPPPKKPKPKGQGC